MPAKLPMGIQDDMIFFKLILTNLGRHRIRIPHQHRRHRLQCGRHADRRHRFCRARSACSPASFRATANSSSSSATSPISSSATSRQLRPGDPVDWPHGRRMPTRCSSASSPAQTTPSSPALALPRRMRASARHVAAGDRADFGTNTDDVVLGERAADFCTPRSAAMCRSATAPSMSSAS